MSTREIEALLDLYYKGETSDSQEAQLLNFFKQEDVPQHLEVDKALFLSKYELSSLSKIEVPENLEQELSNFIDDISAKSNHTIMLFRWIGGIAASLAIIFFIGYQMVKTEPELIVQVEVPKEVVVEQREMVSQQQVREVLPQTDVAQDVVTQQQQVEEILKLVSRELKKGMDLLAKADSKMTNSIKILQNNLKTGKNEN